ncbi:MAG: AAA family ATPase [Reinekea sp.]
MKISKILIKNYRSCAETEFSPNEELTALIGPNGSGKTTILSAIRLLSALLHVRNRRFHTDETASSASEIKVWYDWNGKTIIHTAKINIVTNENNRDEIINSSESWYMYDIVGTKKRINIPLEIFFDLATEKRRHASGVKGGDQFFLIKYFKQQGFNENAYEAIEAVVSFILKINYYSASQFTNPSNCPLSFEVEGEKGIRRGISIRGHKKLLYDMYQEFRNKTDISIEFLDIVGADGIGLVDNIEFNEIETSTSNYSVMTGGKVTKKERKNLLIIPSFSISGNNLSPSQLSEGTFKTLALIFYLISDKSTLLMIEEPEVCVHHGLLNSIIELIKVYSSEKQILISTHSDAVLDNLEVENVFTVKRKKQYGTIVSNISKNMKKKELKVLKDYLINEGSLGEYWKHGDLEHV